MVIASEMNYLAEIETEGEKEIVIELPSPSQPLSFMPGVITSAVQKAIFLPYGHTHTLPHSVVSAEGSIGAGSFHRLIVPGHAPAL